MKIKEFFTCRLFGHRPMKLIKYTYYNEVMDKNVGLFECVGCGKKFKAFSVWPFLREEVYNQEVVNERD